MSHLVDGLGNEELGGAGDTGSKDAQLWITGSVTSESIIQDSNGILESTHFASGTVTRDTSAYGANLKVGGFTMPAGSEASVIFDEAFSTGSYAMFFSVAGNAGALGSETLYISGAMRASGCEVVGQASQKYNYLAVGI